MVDAVGATQSLHKVVLSWDYWEISEKQEETGGVFDKLEAVPTTFASMQVGMLWTWRQRWRRMERVPMHACLHDGACRTTKACLRPCCWRSAAPRS
jgi:hypothetical protein